MLAPVRTWTPAPLLTRDSEPAPPSTKVPPKVAVPVGSAMVRVAAPTALFTAPVPDSERMVLLKPTSARAPFTVKSELGESAVAEKASSTPVEATIVAAE